MWHYALITIKSTRAQPRSASVERSHVSGQPKVHVMESLFAMTISVNKAPKNEETALTPWYAPTRRPTSRSRSPAVDDSQPKRVDHENVEASNKKDHDPITTKRPDSGFRFPRTFDLAHPEGYYQQVCVQARPSSGSSTDSCTTKGRHRRWGGNLGGGHRKRLRPKEAADSVKHAPRTKEGKPIW